MTLKHISSYCSTAIGNSCGEYKEPVNDDGAPVEDVIQFAKEHLDEEIVNDLVEYCTSMRNTFNLNNEMSEQDFMQIIASDMSDGEEHKALRVTTMCSTSEMKIIVIYIDPHNKEQNMISRTHNDQGAGGKE